MCRVVLVVALAVCTMCCINDGPIFRSSLTSGSTSRSPVQTAQPRQALKASSTVSYTTSSTSICEMPDLARNFRATTVKRRSINCACGCFGTPIN